MSLILKWVTGPTMFRHLIASPNSAAYFMALWGQIWIGRGQFGKCVWRAGRLAAKAAAGGKKEEWESFSSFLFFPGVTGTHCSGPKGKYIWGQARVKERKRSLDKGELEGDPFSLYQQINSSPKFFDVEGSRYRNPPTIDKCKGSKSSFSLEPSTRLYAPLLNFCYIPLKESLFKVPCLNLCCCFLVKNCSQVAIQMTE